MRKRRYASAVVIAAAAVGIVLAATGAAAPPDGPTLTNVATANTKSPGYAPASKLSPELRQVSVAQGATKLENGNAQVSYYGYDNDLVNTAGEPQMLPTPAVMNEAQKTEPDKNTYLVFRHGLGGADPNYDYGTDFLFQGHEAGAPGYITRINLDADAAHRVTLLATATVTGTPLPDFDGSTWDPWAQQLLFTAEISGLNGGVWASNLAVPAAVRKMTALGSGGYEGIQNDNDGNLWIAEDVGGANKAGTPARIPNSFIYRFIPESRGDLTQGKLQVLQVLNAAGAPITKASQTPLNSPDQIALHTYHSNFRTNWITIHDTAVDGTAPFDANAAATAHNGTPFKRPENGQFRPDSHFREFYFDETGDTNAGSPENPIGGWTGVFKLVQRDPSADSGTLSLFYNGDQAHAAFDNVTFLSRNAITFVEDAGDGLHASRNALDSGWVLNVTRDYSNPANQPLRWLAEGRDASATIDSAFAGFGKNDGDNEITGAHVSNGDPGPHGILGEKAPHLFDGPGDDGAWRWFYTQQHGDNNTYEVISAERR